MVDSGEKSAGSGGKWRWDGAGQRKRKHSPGINRSICFERLKKKIGMPC